MTPPFFGPPCINLFLLFSLQVYGTLWDKLVRAVEIWSGLGMSLTGVHTCGDYMFSGHTSVITLANFFITECKFDTQRCVCRSGFVCKLMLVRKVFSLIKKIELHGPKCYQNI